MLPLMREPMVLELAPVAERIAVGDVVVFESDGKLVAHRVTSLRDSKLQTCGDARPWSPEYPARHVLVGKVKAVFENDRSGAVRVDTKIFRLRGAFYARTRALRALPFRARASGRRIGRALPWRRERSYLALVDSMAAVVQGDRVGFERSLSRVEPSALVAMARRHGCSATLVEALRTFQTTGEAADYLRRVLQPLVRQGVMLTIALRGQIESIAATLARHNVPFALLKERHVHTAMNQASFCTRAPISTFSFRRLSSKMRLQRCVDRGTTSEIMPSYASGIRRVTIMPLHFFRRAQDSQSSCIPRLRRPDSSRLRLIGTRCDRTRNGCKAQPAMCCAWMPLEQLCTSQCTR